MKIENCSPRAKSRGKFQILVISGPTSTGKTNLALKLAHQFNGELISADSRQIYKGMDIGTGKDIEKGRWDEKNHTWIISGIPIYMLDQITPDKTYHVAQYVNRAGETIKKILSSHHLPIIVGGTGFYIKSLLAPPATLGIPQNFRLRKDLNSKIREDLQEILKKLDPQKFNSLNYSDQNNPRRLVRAIEVAEYDSKIPPKKNQKFDRVVHISLTAPLPYIYKLGEKRIDEMVKNGLVDEIKNLLKNYSWGSPGLKTLGYIEFKEFFEGEKTLEECVQRFKFNQHSMIRRQSTWFKKQKDKIFIDISKEDPFTEAKNLLLLAL